MINNTQQEQILDEYYLKFKQDMRTNYNWNINIGEFKYIVYWLLHGNLITDLSNIKETNNGKRQTTTAKRKVTV